MLYTIEIVKIFPAQNIINLCFCSGAKFESPLRPRNRIN